MTSVSLFVLLIVTPPLLSLTRSSTLGLTRAEIDAAFDIAENGMRKTQTKPLHYRFSPSHLPPFPLVRSCAVPLPAPGLSWREVLAGVALFGAAAFGAIQLARVRLLLLFVPCLVECRCISLIKNRSLLIASCAKSIKERMVIRTAWDHIRLAGRGGTSSSKSARCLLPRSDALSSHSP